jgi:23S rRNA pseudouridine1911/1915/1917 synthase
MGCPIRGDVKYGYPKTNPEGDINLHARKIYFEHPIRKVPMICVASVPQTPFWEEFLEFDDLHSKEKNMENWYEG